MVTFSNPRLTVELDDFPSGAERVKCKFGVESHPKKGCRAYRITQKHGQWCAPKYATYGGRTVIVDGSDDRTYILRHCVVGFESINIMRSDFKDAEGEHIVYKDNNKDRFNELVGLIKSQYPDKA